VLISAARFVLSRNFPVDLVLKQSAEKQQSRFVECIASDDPLLREK
jgi:hypothetical protein